MSEVASGRATPVTFTAFQSNVRLRCGTATVAVTIYPASARALVTIHLPRTCRGNTFVFAEPVRFRTLANERGELGLVSNAWTSNMGRVQFCVAVAGGGCTTTTITTTRATAPPLSTSLRNLLAGRVYGPRIITRLGNPGGTATIILTEQVVGTTGGGGARAAWVVQQQIEVQVVQF